MHLAHPRTARGSLAWFAGILGISPLLGPPVLIQARVRGWRLRWSPGGAVTASGQHGHRKREKRKQHEAFSCTATPGRPSHRSV